MAVAHHGAHHTAMLLRPPGYGQYQLVQVDRYGRQVAVMSEMLKENDVSERMKEEYASGCQSFECHGVDLPSFLPSFGRLRSIYPNSMALRRIETQKAQVSVPYWCCASTGFMYVCLQAREAGVARPTREDAYQAALARRTERSAGVQQAPSALPAMGLAASEEFAEEADSFGSDSDWGQDDVTMMEASDSFERSDDGVPSGSGRDTADAQLVNSISRIDERDLNRALSLPKAEQLDVLRDENVHPNAVYRNREEWEAQRGVPSYVARYAHRQQRLAEAQERARRQREAQTRLDGGESSAWSSGGGVYRNRRESDAMARGFERSGPISTRSGLGAPGLAVRDDSELDDAYMEADEDPYANEPPLRPRFE